MEVREDDSHGVWGGCWGPRAVAGEGKHRRSSSRTWSSRTRWWSNYTILATDTKNEEILEAELTSEDLEQDRVLSQLADDLLGLNDGEPSAQTTVQQAGKSKYAFHERKLSWPFSVARRIMPLQPAVQMDGSLSNQSIQISEDSDAATSSPSWGQEETQFQKTPKQTVVSEESVRHAIPEEEELRGFDQSSQQVKVPPGYRRLWQSIANIRKGDKFSTASPSSQAQDYTVDLLVKSVLALKPSQRITESTKLTSGLHVLDSRAVAALLKDLAKAGAPHRASQLFDYLRSLPQDHELSRLVDLYTYTTVISQCGNHQQLRRALELVAEMRARGISCNVHTYSALMSVCVKCSECELALDVYGQMLDEGCTPNLVTYNVLIDAFARTEQWAQASEVLDAIALRGLVPEARTYNSIISACGKAGQPDAALRVYQRMLSDGVEPTSTTYTSLISAFGRGGQVEEAMEMYRDMIARGCEANVITYSSLISVCERAGRSDLALGLLDEMKSMGVRPNVVTFNSLLAACLHANDWGKAHNLFESMTSAGCKPDAVTFAVLLLAYERGGQWRFAVSALEKACASGIRLEACAYNAVIGTLWDNGRLSSLRKAVQLLNIAQRQGPLRVQTSTPPASGGSPSSAAQFQKSHGYALSQSSVTAFSEGAVVLVTLRWLSGFREGLFGAMAGGSGRIGAVGAPVMGPAVTSSSNSSSTYSNHGNSGSTINKNNKVSTTHGSMKTLILTRGKHARRDHSYEPIRESMTSLFRAFAVPASCSVTDDGSALFINADAAALPSWAASPSGLAALSIIDFQNVGPNGGPLGAAPLIKEDRAGEVQCRKAFAAVKVFEAQHRAAGISPDALCIPPASVLREDVITCITALSSGLQLREETAHDAVQLCDRLLSLSEAGRQPPPPACAAALLLLACRQAGYPGAILKHGQEALQASGLPISAVLDAEHRVSSVLGTDCSAISPLRVLNLFLERLGCDAQSLQKCQVAHVMVLTATDLVAKAALNPSMAGIDPSIAAAACLIKARQGLGLSPAWPLALRDLTGYDPAAVPDVDDASSSEALLEQALHMMHFLGLAS